LSVHFPWLILSTDGTSGNSFLFDRLSSNELPIQVWVCARPA
jgi:hypothetical protein